MTDPSSAPRPKFLADRNLGRLTVQRLRDRGWDIIRLAEVFPDDAQDVLDEDWLRYAGKHGLIGLTKDKHIRYQPSFKSATTSVFALADGSLSIGDMVERFDAAKERIWSQASTTQREFWMVYSKGRVERRAP